MNEKKTPAGVNSGGQVLLKYAAVLLSGVLSGLPLIFSRLAPLAWVALAPLVAVTTRFRGGYRYGLVWGAGYFGVLYHWFIYLYPLDFAGLDGPSSVAAIAASWIGMTAMQSVEAALVPLLFKLIGRGRRGWYIPPLFASLWVLFEWFQTLGWTGVPWGRLALSQCGCLPMIQSASLLGAYFVSFLIAFVNACIALALLALAEKRPSHAVSFRAFAAAAALTVALNYLFGAAALALYREEGPPVRVAAIQGNIASGDKWADNSSKTAMERYGALTRAAAAEFAPELIVWPETVIPTYINYSEYFKDISALAVEVKATILAGTFWAEPADGEVKTYNAVVTFYPDGKVGRQPYFKRHLVPFGEYLPMAEVIRALLPVLAELNVFKSDLTPGDSAALSTTAKGAVGSLICFDSIYETLALDTVRSGAELIALSTNDSWYRDSAAVWQHNAHAALRSVETGRWMVRAANTGVSSIISPVGEVTESLGPLVEGYVTGTARFRSTVTLYAAIGNLIVPLCAAFTLGTAVFIRVKRK